MGQAFRRASGSIRASLGIESTAVSSKTKSIIDRKPPVAPTDKVEVLRAGENEALDSDSTSSSKADNVLEERDPNFDAMLSQMVGRIKSKPGGKPEMGEAFVVERYNRPMPKLRNTSQESGRYEERPAPPGTLNVAQVRHVILLYQGKADDHDGPMDIPQIAERFHIEAAEIKRILQFLALPPDTNTGLKKNP